MTEKKKVVMKINYEAKGDKTVIDHDDAPQLITEWNIKRILTAVLLLLLVIGCGIYWWSRISTPGSEETIVAEKAMQNLTNQAEPIAESIQPKQIVEPIQTVPTQNTAAIENKPLENGHSPIAIIKTEDKKAVIDDINYAKDPEQVNEAKTEPTQAKILMLPEGIKRALITSSIWKKEPVDNLSSPIQVNKNKASSVFYFTELVDMKGKSVYHVWIYKGDIIFKKKIKIWGDRWRASTSKLINSSATGNWSVQLHNSDGQILNEINFSVVDS